MHILESEFDTRVRMMMRLTDRGSDQWSVDEAVEFFEGSLLVDAEVGLQGKVCHETHRNRAFFSPYTTAKVLKRVPRYEYNRRIALQETANYRRKSTCDGRLLSLRRRLRTPAGSRRRGQGTASHDHSSCKP